MRALQTATLAELYLRQGLVGRARAIFAELAAAGEGAAAEEARRRLRELGPGAGDRIGALQQMLERVQRRRRERSVSHGLP